MYNFVHNDFSNTFALVFRQHGNVVDGSLVGTIRQSTPKSNHLFAVKYKNDGVTILKRLFMTFSRIICHTGLAKNCNYKSPVNACCISPEYEIERRAYDLTGAEALDYVQVAAMFTELLGRPVRYTRPSLPAFAWQRRRRGMPGSMIAVMAGLYTTVSLGLAGRVTEDTAHLLGRAPISLRQFIQDYRACWL